MRAYLKVWNVFFCSSWLASAEVQYGDSEICVGVMYWLRLSSLADEPEVKIEGFDGNWYLNRPNVQLTCRADANPPVTIYQWKLWVCLNPRQKNTPRGWEDESANATCYFSIVGFLTEKIQDVFCFSAGRRFYRMASLNGGRSFTTFVSRRTHGSDLQRLKKPHTPASLVLSRNVSLFICLFMKCVMKIRLGPAAEHNGPITAAAHTPYLPDGCRYWEINANRAAFALLLGLFVFFFLLWSLRTSMQVAEVRKPCC